MEGIWPLVILWLLFSIFGAKKKRGQGPGAGGQTPDRPQSLPDQFRLALEELKRAEMEARGKERRQIAQVFHPKPLPAAVDDDEPSSEDISTIEGLADYDTEAEQLVEERIRAAERRVERLPVSVEGLSTAQAARRSARVDVAIGGKAEHDAWHLQMQATDRRTDGLADGQTEPRKNPLARFADGSIRSAIIMSEILGKPKAGR